MVVRNEPEVYEFDVNHHFFDQVAAFALVVTGAYLTRKFGGIQESVTVARVRHEDISKAFPLDLDVSNVIIGGRVVGSALMNLQMFIDAVMGKGAVSAIRFEEDSFNSGSGNGYPKEGLAPYGGLLRHAALVCLGSAYESTKLDLEKNYGSRFWEWDPLLQYFRHLRNACSHGNHFNIEPPKGKKGKVPVVAINPDNPPYWRSSVMPNDESMQERSLFFEFLRAGDIPIFLADVDAKLRSDGITPSTSG
jgi:hypothetical protein